MRPRLTSFLTAFMLALLASLDAISPGLAHEPGENHDMTDEDKALGALERGEVLPLDRVLANLRDRVPGEISGIELEKENGVWVYEFKVISPRGQMMEVHIDAKTGQLIDEKGH